MIPACVMAWRMLRTVVRLTPSAAARLVLGPEIASDRGFGNSREAAVVGALVNVIGSHATPGRWQADTPALRGKPTCIVHSNRLVAIKNILTHPRAECLETIIDRLGMADRLRTRQRRHLECACTDRRNERREWKRCASMKALMIEATERGVLS